MEEDLPGDNREASQDTPNQHQNTYPNNALFPDEDISGFQSENENDAADLIQNMDDNDLDDGNSLLGVGNVAGNVVGGVNPNMVILPTQPVVENVFGRPPNYGFNPCTTSRTRPITFTGVGGVPQPIRDQLGQSPSVMQCWQLFFTREILTLFGNQTNLYAAQVASSTQRPPWVPAQLNWPPTYVLYWTHVTLHEMMLFFSLTIAFGVTRLPAIHCYWGNLFVACTPQFAAVMSRARYKQIRSLLHLSDNANRPQNAGKLYKVENFLELFRHQCETVRLLYMNVSMDEQIAKTKSVWAKPLAVDRLPKPIRCGVKIWTVCDPESGYVFTFRVDQRIGTIHERIIRLLAVVSGQGHCIYMDNLFTTPKLFDELWTKGVNACGTWRRNFQVPMVLKDATLQLENLHMLVDHLIFMDMPGEIQRRCFVCLHFMNLLEQLCKGVDGAKLTEQFVQHHNV